MNRESDGAEHTARTNQSESEQVDTGLAAIAGVGAGITIHTMFSSAVSPEFWIGIGFALVFGAILLSIHGGKND